MLGDLRVDGVDHALAGHVRTEQPQRVEQIALTSEADVRGRTGFEASDYPQGRLLREAWEIAKAVPTKEVVEAGFKGPEIREELTKRRIDAVAAWKEKRCPQPKD